MNAMEEVIKDMFARWIHDERGHIPDYYIPITMLLVIVVLLVDSLVGHPLAGWVRHFAERLVE